MRCLNARFRVPANLHSCGGLGRGESFFEPSMLVLGQQNELYPPHAPGQQESLKPTPIDSAAGPYRLGQQNSWMDEWMAAKQLLPVDHHNNQLAFFFIFFIFFFPSLLFIAFGHSGAFSDVLP